MKLRIGFVTNSSWDIDETNFNINGFTCMDNGDMNKFLRLIGINRDIVEWEDWS